MATWRSELTISRWTAAALCAAAVIACAAPASAQAADPNPGGATVVGGVDFVNAYHFRGIPQDEDDFGKIIWPYADLGFALYSGAGALKSIGVNVGTWNSLHRGGLGTEGIGKMWYESDFYTTVGLGFGGGTSVGVTYTAYTSPNGAFASVKELGLKFAVDDSGYLGGAAVKPYVLFARELDEDSGQADGGLSLGTYMELGVAPGYAASRFSVGVPVKVGLSLDDYYEGGPDGDERFGFFSIAGIVTVPFTSMPTNLGTWNVHGGVEYLRLGERNQAFGENQVVGSIGIGFTY